MEQERQPSTPAARPPRVNLLVLLHLAASAVAIAGLALLLNIHPFLVVYLVITSILIKPGRANKARRPVAATTAAVGAIVFVFGSKENVLTWVNGSLLVGYGTYFALTEVSGAEGAGSG